MQKKFLNSHRNPMTVLHMVNFKWAHYLLQLPSSPPQHNPYLRNHGGKHDMVVSTTTRSQINSPPGPSSICYKQILLQMEKLQLYPLGKTIFLTEPNLSLCSAYSPNQCFLYANLKNENVFSGILIFLKKIFFKAFKCLISQQFKILSQVQKMMVNTVRSRLS